MKRLLKVFAIIIGIFTFPVYAQNGPQQLRLIYPQQSDLKNQVTVAFELKDNNLKINFKVSTTHIYAKKNLGANEYPYQYDVVEIFLAPQINNQRQPVPYYEFEISPYNQSFLAKIYSLPDNVINNFALDIKHETHQSHSGWEAEILIPLEKLGWRGSDICQITGNAFAILGKQPRSFWSLYLPPQSKPPNFHQPEYFKSLLCSQEPGSPRKNIPN